MGESGRGMLWWLYCLINDHAQPKPEEKSIHKVSIEVFQCFSSETSVCAGCILYMCWCTVYIYMRTPACALCNCLSKEEVKSRRILMIESWLVTGYRRLKMPTDYWDPSVPWLKGQQAVWFQKSSDMAVKTGWGHSWHGLRTCLSALRVYVPAAQRSPGLRFTLVHMIFHGIMQNASHFIKPNYM